MFIRGGDGKCLLIIFLLPTCTRKGVGRLLEERDSVLSMEGKNPFIRFYLAARLRFLIGSWAVRILTEAPTALIEVFCPFHHISRRNFWDNTSNNPRLFFI
jgi:hypothetical protein